MKECFETILKCKVNDKYGGKTVEKILRNMFDVSGSLIKELKLNGRIYINENVCRSVDVAHFGDTVSANVGEYKFSDIPMCPGEPEILFEDAHLMVVNKPPGISVHPSIGNYNKTLAGMVIRHWRRNGEEHNFHAVNRLDKDTSGLCLIAKNKYSHYILSKQQQSGIIKKKYEAIVHGRINNPGEINLPIKRAEEGIIKRAVSPDGKPAFTKFKPICGNDVYTLTELELLTGRTHQIRVHMASIRHPLFGDWLYGNGDGEKSLISRQALNVSKLSFVHPITKESGEFTAGLPRDMKILIENLQKL